MKQIFLILLLLPTVVFAKEQVPKELVKSADTLARLLMDGYEEKMGQEYLKVKFEPRDGSASDNSYLVLYTFEGRGDGNTFIEWIALFSSPSIENLSTNQRRPNKQFFLVTISEIGGKNWRSLHLSCGTQKGSVVEIPCAVWKKEDGGCCPTGKGKVHIRFHKGKLIVK